MLPSQPRYILICGTEVFYNSDVWYFSKGTYLMFCCKVHEILDHDGYFPKEATPFFSELFANKRDCIFAINKHKMSKLYQICKN